MAPYTSLLASALLASSAVAVPAVIGKPGGGVIRQLPVTQQVNVVFNDKDLKALVAADRLRAQGALKGNLAGDVNGGMSSFAKTSAAAVGSAHATNQAIYYTTAVQVGEPSRNYQLILDTGSGNTWVGSKTTFVATNSSVNTGAHVAVNYQSSSMAGNLYYDTVAISSTIKVKSQAIGVATKQTGFNGVDGVLGLGPALLTKGTTSQGASTQLPTFTDKLFTSGVIPSNVVSLAFAPATAVGTVNGQVTFGGIDATAFNAPLTYAPITTTWPSSSYWGVNLGGVAYSGQKLFSAASVPGIVESGLTLVYLSTDAFKKYQSATGAVYDTQTDLLKITSAQLSVLKPLDFTINGVKFSMSPNAQLWARKLNTAIGGAAYNTHLVIADLGTNAGAGLDIILGQKFMERFYTSFDSTGRRVGFATTQYTNSEIN